MTAVVVRARNLGKQYRLGAAVNPISYRTLRDSIHDAARRLVSPRLSSRQETFWALRDLNFEISMGEVVGIIGRNGAGKSTLLKILSRVTEPSSGEVEITGRIGSLLEVGTGFHPELSGRENIFLNGAILGMKRSEIRRQFDAIVAFAEVERFIDTPVKHYSSGMYTRLAFAVAAHLEPEILIVDEVLAVGDAAFQKKCLGKMGDVARGGRTVLFVSHQMAMIETLCQRAMLLDKGQITATGGTSAVIREYLSTIAAVVEEEDLRGLVRSGSGEVRLTRFWLEDDSGHKVLAVASGARVTLAFEYEATVGPNSRASFGFALLASDDYPVARLYSDYQGDTFFGLPEHGVVRFTFDRLPFANGTYYVDGRVMVNGSEADWPRDHIGKVEVDAGDFYGAGQAFHSGICSTLIEGHWSVSASA